MAGKTRRVLLIAYQFPPVGGAGVQRAAKFTKYLPEHGWDVSVLTVSNPSVPVVDRSLIEDIPPQTLIRRAKSWEPDYRLKQKLAPQTPAGTSSVRWTAKFKRALRNAATNLLQPDPQVLWAPQAIRQGLRLLRELPHDAILVTAPPFSSFLVGAALRRLSGVPLVLDYRDEWTISNQYWENKSRHPLVARFLRRLQKVVLRHADMAIATTRRSARALDQEARDAGRPLTVHCVYNGFDPADLPEAPEGTSQDDEGRFRLAHVGTLWNLTTALPLVSAIERLADRRPELIGRLDVEVVGRCTQAEEALLQRLQRLPCRLVRRDYVDHKTAVEAMHQASELCLLLADVLGAERVLPGKTFEYLAAGREILAIAPPGEMQDVLRGFAGVSAFSPSDLDGISEHLARRLTDRSFRTSYQRATAHFERRYQAGQLAALLNQLDAAAAHAPTPAVVPELTA